MQPRNDEVQSEVHKRSDVPLQPLCSSLSYGRATAHGMGEALMDWNAIETETINQFWWIDLFLYCVIIDFGFDRNA